MAIALSATLAACGGASSGASNFAVDQRAETFTDPGRSTPANGNVPRHQGRTLLTNLYYPATGGPYPLIVFAHGFTGQGTDYHALLSAWAATGYVVAAPDFPLSSHNAAGGPSIADYFNQPGDVSFVITAVSKLSADHHSPLSGRVDTGHVGVAGHSLGGITILGLATNTCCRDKRVAAAVAMAGDAVGFQGGSYMSAGTPPLLLVHGDHDPTVPYQGSRDAFSSSAPPKFLVTLLGGDHIGPYFNIAGPAYAAVVRTTVDFFDTYLKGRHNALDRLKTDGQVPGVAREEQVLIGSGRPPPPPATSTPSTRAMKAVPDSGVLDGQPIHVSWQGFTPGSPLNILECIRNATGPADCDLGHATLFHPAGPNGSGELSFVVHSGPIGRGRCDPGNSCLIVVNEGGTAGLTGTVAAIVTFAP
jgi:fermentation-respiration switch protein FrsA (DUF1100 family)